MDHRERHRAVIRCLFDEVLNGREEAALAEIHADRYVDHAPLPGETPGPTGVQGRLELLRAAFTDARFTLEDTIAQGDEVVARWTLRGRTRGRSSP